MHLILIRSYQEELQGRRIRPKSFQNILLWNVLVLDDGWISEHVLINDISDKNYIIFVMSSSIHISDSPPQYLAHIDIAVVFYIRDMNKAPIIRPKNTTTTLDINLSCFVVAKTMVYDTIHWRDLADVNHSTPNITVLAIFMAFIKLFWCYNAKQRLMLQFENDTGLDAQYKHITFSETRPQCFHESSEIVSPTERDFPWATQLIPTTFECESVTSGILVVIGAGYQLLRCAL